MYFKGEKIKKEGIRPKIWQGIEKSLNGAKRAFLFLICGIFTQLSWLVKSLRNCLTTLSSESISNPSNSEGDLKRYKEVLTTPLYSKKLYFPDSFSRKVYWSEKMCTRKVLKKPTNYCVKPKESQEKATILNDDMKSKILFCIKSIKTCGQ